MEDMHGVVQREFFLSLISAVKERMSMLRHQTRDFEAWRKPLSTENCTRECDANWRLLLTMLQKVEADACDFVSIYSGPFARTMEEIVEMHFLISKQQEMMHLATLGLLFPERGLDVSTVDRQSVRARSGDFYIAYFLNKVETFLNVLEERRAAIRETYSSIANHFQSSSTDPSAIWLEAKINFLDTHIALCKDRVAAISALLVEFRLNAKGQRILPAAHWDAVQLDTHDAQIKVILWKHLYAAFFTTMSGGYQFAMDMGGMPAP